MKLREQRGFTLAELLVVVLILGVIGALVIPKFAAQPEKARQAVVKADLKTIKSALDVYQIEDPAAGFPTTPDKVREVLGEAGIQWTGDENGIRDPWGGPYRYQSDGTKYTVVSTGQKDGLNWYVTEKQDPLQGGPAGTGGGGIDSCTKQK